MTYNTCKKVIETQLRRGTLDADNMKAKLDVFLLADRITAAEYDELVALMDSGV